MKNVIRSFGFGALMSFVLFLLAPNAGGATGFSFPPIGTAEKVEAYAVSKINRIWIFAWAFKQDGNYQSYGANSYAIGKTPLTSIEAVNQIVHEGMQMAFTRLIADTNSSLNKSAGLRIGTICHYEYTKLDTISVYKRVENVPVKVDKDGFYVVPDVSWYRVDLVSVPLLVPSLKWASLEIGTPGSEYPYQVSNLVVTNGLVLLPQDIVSVSATTNSYSWYRISILTDTNLFLFDGDGNSIARTPFSIGISRYGTDAVTVSISGGDYGQGFYLEQSTDGRTWARSTPTNIASKQSWLGHGEVRRFNFHTSGSPAMFFRTVSSYESPPF